MNSDDLQFGQPLICQDIVIIPLVRKVIIRSPPWISGAISPVALVMLDSHDIHLALLDDTESEQEIVSWLNGEGK